VCHWQRAAQMKVVRVSLTANRIFRRRLGVADFAAIIRASGSQRIDILSALPSVFGIYARLHGRSVTRAADRLRIHQLLKPRDNLRCERQLGGAGILDHMVWP
jgi:hypothetical protein